MLSNGITNEWKPLDKCGFSKDEFWQLTVKTKFMKHKVKGILTDIIYTCCWYFFMTPDQFAECFFEVNEQIEAKIDRLFKEKTNVRKLVFRIDTEDKAFKDLIDSILLPSIDRVKVMKECYFSLSFEEKYSFLKDVFSYSEIAEYPKVYSSFSYLCNMYDCLSPDKQEEFLKAIIDSN